MSATPRTDADNGPFPIRFDTFHRKLVSGEVCWVNAYAQLAILTGTLEAELARCRLALADRCDNGAGECWKSGDRRAARTFEDLATRLRALDQPTPEDLT